MKYVDKNDNLTYIKPTKKSNLGYGEVIESELGYSDSWNEYDYKINAIPNDKFVYKEVKGKQKVKKR